MQCESCGHENIDGAKFCASCGILLPQPGGEHPWIGRLVGGRFRVTKVLGEGGMGVVYAGEQQMGSTTRRVAIKTLHPHLSQDPSVLARFHRECGTVSQLEHPNTIKVYDFGAEADGTLYIAMEYVDGRSLDKVIEGEGPLSPSRVVAIFKQVCGALDEAHGLGVVHRDLKPENIVLGERLGNPDFVKVLDFGIAARSESASAQREQKLTQQGMVLGTPPYMSPEQFTGQELDRRSDVYSLGIIAYEMLTCRLPFNATTPWQWATEHMTAQPFPMDQVPTGVGVPRSMREAVMRALSKDPNERPGSAGAFVAELEQGLDGLESHGPASRARTEAMQVAPAFATGEVPGSRLSGPGSIGGVAPGSAPFSGGAVSGAVSSGSMGTSHAMASTQEIAIPVKKSNAGALALLGGAVVVVGAAAFFLIPRGNKEEDKGTGGSAGVAATSAPTPPVTAAPTPTPPVTSEPTPTAPPATSDPTPTAPTSTPTPPTPSTGTTTTPKPPVETTKSSDPTACKNAAAAGDWGKIAGLYSKYDAKAQKDCAAQVRRNAGSQITGASCSKLKSMQSAVRGTGQSIGKLDDALAKCK